MDAARGRVLRAGSCRATNQERAPRIRHAVYTRFRPTLLICVSFMYNSLGMLLQQGDNNSGAAPCMTSDDVAIVS